MENEITVNSTDEERTAVLLEKALTVVRWDKKHSFRQTNAKESITHALGRYMDELKLRGKIMHFKDFSGEVRFTRNTLHESIRQMTKRHSDLANLGRALSVIDDICLNAVKIEVEPYRHLQPKTGNGFKQMHQYLSAFHDMEYIYPVKITIREAEGNQSDRFYMVITVGIIEIENKIKEALTNTRVHPETGESLHAGGASFKINIPQFISAFNNEEGIILKNLPDGLLNNEQKQIKQKVLKADAQKLIQKEDEPLDATIAAIEEGKRIATNPNVEGYVNIDDLKKALNDESTD